MNYLRPKANHYPHKTEHARPQVMDFIRQQIALGRQAYIIYPLIEESSKLDYENLMKGFEEVKSFFPEPKVLDQHGTWQRCRQNKRK